MSHTQGPWIKRKSHKNPGDWTIRPADPDAPGYTNGYAPIAWVRGDERAQTKEQNKANATLIAAAPDLLAALQLAGSSAGFQYMTHETRAAIESAIAKATGEKA